MFSFGDVSMVVSVVLVSVLMVASEVVQLCCTRVGVRDRMERGGQVFGRIATSAAVRVACVQHAHTFISGTKRHGTYMCADRSVSWPLRVTGWFGSFMYGAAVAWLDGRHSLLCGTARALMLPRPAPMTHKPHLGAELWQ